MLKALSEAGVEHILVGGLAAIAQGAPVTTFDVDVVPLRSEENLARLDTALRTLEARFRRRPDLVPQVSHTRARGHLQLETRYGYLDVLMYIGNGLEFEDLVTSAISGSIDGVPIRILSLEKLIAIKQELGHAKDLATLPVLRAALAMRNANNGGSGSLS